MDRYKRYVDIIRYVTGIEVEVFYDSFHANCSGGAYAGFYEYEESIAPDLYENPLMDFIDYLEQEHVRYYHIGLPDDIACKFNEDDIHGRIMRRLVKRAGVSYGTEVLEVFIILHEFGHVDRLFTHHGGSIQKYVLETVDRGRVLYNLKYMSKVRAAMAYRQIPAEKYADEFAIKHLPAVLSILQRG